MTIWVGHDGTLNDDEGDGPAVAGDPMETLAGYGGYGGYGYGGYPGVYPGHFHGYPGYYAMPYEYVGEDDWGSALGSIGSALGTAFGGSGSGGGGGGGGGGGFDFGSLGSSLGSALGQAADSGGGGGDTGAAIANIFGQVAKVAVPAATQAIARSQSHPQPQTQPPVQAPTGTPTAPPVQQRARTAPVQRTTQPSAQRPSQPRARQGRALDPKTKLNLALSHLGKQYGLTPPSDSGKSTLGEVGSFVQNMMGGPKDAKDTGAAASAATSGEFVGDLGDLLGDLESSIHHRFSRGPGSYGVPHIPFGFGVNFSLGQRGRTYPAYSTPRQPQYYADQGYSPSYPYSPDQGYARQQGYAQQQSYAQPQATYAQSQGPYAQQQGMYAPPRTMPVPVQTRASVTYQPYPMPPLQKKPVTTEAGPKKWSSWAMEVGPITVTHPDTPRMIQVSASAPRKVGKFISKMMGGPGAHPKAMPDEDLRRVQRTLNQYYATTVLVEDGIMGDETHRILKWFQKSNALPETGNPDPAVMAMLDRLLADRATSQGLAPAGDAGAIADSSDWLTKSPLATSSDFRTGIQSTSMYDSQNYYTDSYGAWVLPMSPEEWWYEWS